LGGRKNPRIPSNHYAGTILKTGVAGVEKRGRRTLHALMGEGKLKEKLVGSKFAPIILLR